MSLIIHRCLTCKHPDLFHTDTDNGNTKPRSYGACTGMRHEFGSSGAWDDIPAAVHSLDSAVTRGEWETEAGMPDPETILAGEIQ